MVAQPYKMIPDQKKGLTANVDLLTFKTYQLDESFFIYHLILIAGTPCVTLLFCLNCSQKAFTICTIFNMQTFP